jgi:hypothetical protein
VTVPFICLPAICDPFFSFLLLSMYMTTENSSQKIDVCQEWAEDPIWNMHTMTDDRHIGKIEARET